MRPIALRTEVALASMLCVASCAAPAPREGATATRRSAVYTLATETLSPSVASDVLTRPRAGGDRIAAVVPGLAHAYIFTRSGTTWGEEQRIDLGGPNNAGVMDFDGSTLVVGRPADATAAANAGAAVVYERTGTTWAATATLVASDAAAGDQLGTTVAVRGDDLFVGTFWRGSVYWFARQGASFVEQQKLVHTNLGGAFFGWAIRVDGDTLWIAQRDAGAFVYQRTGSTWVESQHLDRVSASDGLGWSIDLEGDRGAIARRSSTTMLYERTGTTWSEVTEVSPSTPQATMGAFPSLGIGSGVLAVGCEIDDVTGEDAGAVFTFSDRSGTWAEAERVESPEPTYLGRFGSLDLAGTTLAVTGNQKLYLYDLVPKGNRGEACDEGRKCASGSCADGVCCDAPCTSECEACAGSATGLADGICGAVTAGSDPRNDCPDPAPDSCGPDGLCDGAGVCRAATPEGAACGAVTCDNRQRTTLACDGAGMCLPAAESCGDYACDGDGCRTSCTSEDHCAPDFACTEGVCTPPDQCSADGTEVVRGGGTREECAPFTCLAGACLARCAATTDCAGGFVCDPETTECIDTDPADGPSGGPSSDGGCGCRTARHGAGGNGALGAALLAVAVGMLRRRRGRARGIAVGTSALLAVGCSTSDPSTSPTGVHRDAVSWVSATPEVVLGGEPASDAQWNAQRVALVGDVMVATLGDEVGIHRRQGSVWTKDQALTVPQPLQTGFGRCLGFDGATIVIGEPEAPGTGAGGQLRVYSLAGSVWQESAVIPPEPSTFGLGSRCAVAGDTIAASAAEAFTGAVHVVVFERTGGTFALAQTLTVTDEPAEFAYGLSLDADRMLVLQRGTATPGLAHFYARDATGWAADGSIAPPAPCAIGRAATVDGDRAVIGTSGCTETLVAERTGGAWALVAGATWDPPSPAEPQGYAMDAAFHDDMLILGHGAFDLVDLFTANGSGWRLHQRITMDVSEEYFGASVSADSGWLAVSAPNELAPPHVHVYAYALNDAASPGAVCTGAAQCVSGWCVEGVCCDADCAGACSSCLAALTGATDGTCAPTTAGTDPDDDCAPCSACDGARACEPVAEGNDPLDDCDADGTNRCGPDGACDGEGACRSAALEGTGCGDTTCETGQAAVPECDGQGSCVAAPTACEPYACDGTSCGTSCTDADGCADGFVCTAGECVPPGACSADGTGVVGPERTTSCAPYLCEEGACARECSVSSDCVPGYVCDGTGGVGTCVAPPESAGDGGGCGCRIGATRHDARAVAVAALACAMLGARTRRRRVLARR